MSLGQRRLVFCLVWLLFVFSGPITVFRNTSIESLNDSLVLTNFLQRLTGLLAFSLIFIQIILGAYMHRWLETLGSSAFKIHITQGLAAYGLILVHPLLGSTMVYLISRNLTDAIYFLVPSIKSPQGLGLLYGQIALILGNIAVVVGYFRTHPFFRKNWRAFHILNYFVFYLVVFHTLNLATDIAFFPFNLVYWFMIALVTATLGYRLISPVIAKTNSPKSFSESEAVAQDPDRKANFNQKV